MLFPVKQQSEEALRDSAKRKRIRRNPEELREIVDQFDRSKLSRSAFCRKYGLAPSTFARWYGNRSVSEQARAGRPKADAAEFIELGDGVQGFVVDGKSSSPAEPAWDIELQIGDGMVLRLRRRC